MKISFDLDGTYLENQILFDIMAVRIKRAGGKVGILTARPFSHHISPGFTPDFEFYLGAEGSIPERCYEKAVKMRAEGIDFTFDDQANDFPDWALALHIDP